MIFRKNVTPKGPVCDRCGKPKPGLNHIRDVVNGQLVKDELVCSDCMRS